jgi:predicted HTH transcriptional regulator
MQETILITNYHPDVFAFALNETGEQVFIPPYATEGTDLQRGKRYQAVLIENHKEHQRERTPWMAVSVLGDTPAPAAEPAPAPEPFEIAVPIVHIEDRDEAIFKLICESDYMTSSELAEHSGFDSKTAGNSALRLFNAGRIAKADVYNRVGQSRSSFTLWAESASKFVE